MSDASRTTKQRGYMDFGPPEFVMVLVIAALIALLIFGIRADIAEQRRWDEYALEHHCKVVGQMAGDTVVGVAPVVGGNGNGGVAVVTTTTSSKTAYQCDDGVTYWRNN